MTLIYKCKTSVRLSYLVALISAEVVSLGLHFICLYLFMFARNISIDTRIYYPLSKLALLTSIQSIALQSFLQSKTSKNVQIAGNQI